MDLEEEMREQDEAGLPQDALGLGVAHRVAEVEAWWHKVGIAAALEEGQVVDESRTRGGKAHVFLDR